MLTFSELHGFQSRVSDIHVSLKGEISDSSIRVQNSSINQNTHKSVIETKYLWHGATESQRIPFIINFKIRSSGKAR
jgi:hypothetical protein